MDKWEENAGIFLSGGILYLHGVMIRWWGKRWDFAESDRIGDERPSTNSQKGC